MFYLSDVTSVSITAELKGDDDESSLTSVLLARFRLLLVTALQLRTSRDRLQKRDWSCSPWRVFVFVLFGQADVKLVSVRPFEILGTFL